MKREKSKLDSNKQAAKNQFEGKKYVSSIFTAQKMKFSIMDFLIKYDQIHWKLPIWSYLLKKSFIENLFFVQGEKYFRFFNPFQVNAPNYFDPSH